MPFSTISGKCWKRTVWDRRRSYHHRTGQDGAVPWDPILYDGGLICGRGRLKLDRQEPINGPLAPVQGSWVALALVFAGRYWQAKQCALEGHYIDGIAVDQPGKGIQRGLRTRQSQTPMEV